MAVYWADPAHRRHRPTLRAVRERSAGGRASIHVDARRRFFGGRPLRIFVELKRPSAHMKITGSKRTCCPFPCPNVASEVLRRGAHILKRDAMLVRISTTRDYSATRRARPAEKTKQAIDRLIALPDRSALWAIRCVAHVVPTGRWSRRPRSAKSTAQWRSRSMIWAAKARNLPVSRTDRRRVRDRIRLYGSAGMTCHRTSTLQKRCACAKWVSPHTRCGRDAGLMGSCRRSPDARSRGPDFELMVDAHTWWRMGDRAIRKKPSSAWQTDGRVSHRVLEEPMPPTITKDTCV